MFYLTSSDLSELIVPATVTVPSGRTNLFIPVTIVDDTEYDGQQIATVSVSPSAASSSATSW